MSIRSGHYQTTKLSEHSQLGTSTVPLAKCRASCRSYSFELRQGLKGVGFCQLSLSCHVETHVFPCDALCDVYAHCAIYPIIFYLFFSPPLPPSLYAASPSFTDYFYLAKHGNFNPRNPLSTYTSNTNLPHHQTHPRELPHAPRPTFYSRATSFPNTYSTMVAVLPPLLSQSLLRPRIDTRPLPDNPNPTTPHLPQPHPLHHNPARRPANPAPALRTYNPARLHLHRTIVKPPHRHRHLWRIKRRNDRYTRAAGGPRPADAVSAVRGWVARVEGED